MSIAIVCFPGCDVIRFEISLVFQTKLFFHMTEKSRQKSHTYEEGGGTLQNFFLAFIDELDF